MEGMEGGSLWWGGGGGGGAMEDKRLFTHGTQSQRTAKDPGACRCLLGWVTCSKPCEEKKEGRGGGGVEG